MRLRQLEAQFLRYAAPTPEEPHETHHYVDTLAEADGIMFLCPKCYPGHMVICWFVGKVPDHVTPKPGRWNPQGTGLDDLTFVPPGSTSVLLLGSCNWHGFVKDGDAT